MSNIARYILFDYTKTGVKKGGFLGAILVVLMCCPTKHVAAQNLYLTGIVRDSASYQPLSYVNIQHNTGKIIAASDTRGYFSFTAQLGDTLVFTRLGYTPYLFIPKENAWDLNIKLVETSKMLDNVTIYDKFEIHGQNQIQKSIREGAKLENSAFQNPTTKPGNDYAVQTFGPGYTFKGAFSSMSKDEIEKRRLRAIYQEQQRTGVYREVIQSEQVKQYLTRLFTLNDSVYYKKLEQFAVKYPGAENLRTRQEIVDMLVAFLSVKDKE